jgi:hypothetical protein
MFLTTAVVGIRELSRVSTVLMTPDIPLPHRGRDLSLHVEVVSNLAIEFANISYACLFVKFRIHNVRKEQRLRRSHVT